MGAIFRDRFTYSCAWPQPLFSYSRADLAAMARTMVLSATNSPILFTPMLVQPISRHVLRDLRKGRLDAFPQLLEAIDVTDLCGERR